MTLEESILRIMEDRLDLERETSTKLLKWFRGIRLGDSGVITHVSQREIEKEMATYFEPWHLLLPKKLLDPAYSVAQSIATRTYSLPRQSALFVDRSWKGK